MNTRNQVQTDVSKQFYDIGTKYGIDVDISDPTEQSQPQQFNKSLVNNKYHMIKHTQAAQHCLNVEKLATETGGVRFSGKKNGRDDHFWSKAIANYCFLNTSRGDAITACGEKRGFQQRHRVHNMTQNSGFLTF